VGKGHLRPAITNPPGLRILFLFIVELHHCNLYFAYSKSKENTRRGKFQRDVGRATTQHAAFFSERHRERRYLMYGISADQPTTTNNHSDVTNLTERTSCHLRGTQPQKNPSNFKLPSIAPLKKRRESHSYLSSAPRRGRCFYLNPHPRTK
jgi:hypothetical protein